MLTLAAEAEIDVAARSSVSSREFLFSPENLVHFQAFDTDLAGFLADPDNAGMRPFYATLQQDHVA